MPTQPKPEKVSAPESARFSKGQKVLCIIPPKIQAMMTAVWRVQRAHDLTQLDYTDGTKESAMIPLKRWEEINHNFFSIVREVQDLARKGAQP